jgi:hypothetical protein
MLAEPVAVTLLVTHALETLGVPYLIGGSLASALHGVVRTTLELDYLRHWAVELRVADLLEKALTTE